MSTFERIAVAGLVFVIAGLALFIVTIVEAPAGETFDRQARIDYTANRMRKEINEGKTDSLEASDMYAKVAFYHRHCAKLKEPAVELIEAAEKVMPTSFNISLKALEARINPARGWTFEDACNVMAESGLRQYEAR